jgi:hypothetical protein
LSSHAKHPDWQKDYSTAYARALEKQKPLAVFIAPGSAGPQQVVASGGFSLEANKLLEEQYVCVYIDSESEAGKKLAESFELTQGLVISDKTGGKQVLRHEGTVETKDLNRYLADVIEPTAVLTSTSTGTRANPAHIPRRPIRNAVGAVRDAFSPSPFDPTCRT